MLIDITKIYQNTQLYSKDWLKTYSVAANFTKVWDGEYNKVYVLSANYQNYVKSIKFQLQILEFFKI